MIIKYARIFLLLFLYCSAEPIVFCQPIENHFTHYTTKDGLADGMIRSIVQDSVGFLWIGNENGLSRFDGHTFKVYRYNPLDTNSLRENRVWNLFTDSKKRLWILTFHWLYLYHPEDERFEHFSVNSSVDGRFDKICAEENDQLIITGYNALYRFDEIHKKFSVFHHDGMVSQSVGDYHKDENGVEWMASEKGLMRYDSKTKSCTTDSNVIAAYMNFLPGGYLLASGCSNGLFLINRKTYSTQSFLPDKKKPSELIRCSYPLNDSIFLIASDGVSIFNLNTKMFVNFKQDKLNPTSVRENDREISCIFRDREGIIWIGGEHLEKYDFKDYAIKAIPYSNNDVQTNIFEKFYCLHRCTDGNFLLGGYFGTGVYNQSTDQLKNYFPGGPDGQIIYCLEDDGRGRIWCITTLFNNHHPKICVCSEINNELKIIKQYDLQNFSDDYISDMKPGRNGYVLLATKNRGFMKFDTTTETFTIFDADTKSPSQLTSSSGTSICEDHSGCVWVGTKKGLNKIEKDGVTVKQYGRTDKPYSQVRDWYVTDIKEDRYGVIWFTTLEHGIGRIDPRNDSVRFFSIGQGLPTCWSKGLCIDDEDNLWALSKMGIVNLNVVTFQNRLYTEDEGFPTPDEVAAPDDKGSICYNSSTQKLYILTASAIYEIDGKNVNHYDNIPQTTITGISVFEKEEPVSMSNNISLNYNENFIDIRFACLLFHSNKQIKYAYKMEGVDKDWVYCNYKRNASYTNLSPGNYVFSVKAQSPAGVWNKTPTLLAVIIKPPYWQTWWFYLLEAMAGFAVAAYVIRFYTAAKLAKQKNEIEKMLAVSNERSRIASEMHDELGSGLTSIRMLSEIAGGKINRDLIPKSEIEKIERSAGNLSENLREIIWTMNTRFDKLDDFIVYVRSYAVEYFDESTISFHFKSPNNVPAVTLNGELRRNVFLCFKEALHNIVKHSGATVASLSFTVGDNLLIAEIKDNGIGIDGNKMNKFGNGLSTMQERMNKLGGDLEIEICDGTKLIFRINI